MTLSLPLVVILGAVVWVLLRHSSLKFLHAVVCILFGFYLASTIAAPEVRRLVSTVIRTITGAF
ncbi:membrane protein [Planobispora rosea]|uniref:Membrane protein n=1 Tax=Planobispora rosea TaxID=35762 RepID=A0A8J3S2U7_PLARO|nr:hypothetical protein [Planobispora rosea]GGS94686.1 membrane protein [Planobispora rosea]GIH87416.1 membrane protein [Planobispora rosea]